MASRHEALRNRHLNINNVLRTFGWSLSALALAASGRASITPQFTADSSLPAQRQQSFLLSENRPTKINLGDETVEIKYTGMTDLNCTFVVNEGGEEVPQTLKVVADNMTTALDGRITLPCNPELKNGKIEASVNSQATIFQE